MNEELLKIIIKDKMGINIYLLDYINAAIDLGAKYRFITPPYHRIHTHAEVSNGTTKIRIINATPSINNSVASEIAKQKSVVNRLLQDSLIRVPKQNVIRVSDSLTEIVNQIQYPVVIKPLALSRSKGVTTDINSIKQLNTAIEKARKASNSIYRDFVIIEEMIKGNNYRVLVLDTLVIAASQKHLPNVIGNGKSTILDLINLLNRSCRGIPRIAIDNNIANTLAAQGYSPQSIPSVGKVVTLHQVASLSRGVVVEDVTKKIHPEFEKIIVAAVKEIGLRLAGVDLLAEDISIHPEEQQYCIIEVNSHPGTRMHLNPHIGDPVNAPKVILASLLSFV